MRFSDSRRVFVSAVILLCLLHSVVGAGIVAGANADPVSGPVQSVTQQTEPVNNTTVQQEDPDSVNEQGDSDVLRSYLAQKLADRLGESSTQINQGQYEQGQSVLGDEYDALLKKYVDVEGGTGDKSAAESFEEASENQREYGSTVEEYNETYQEYKEAKENGNGSRARELARKLDRIADQVNSTGQNVTRSYTKVANTTGTDLSEATETVESTSKEIQDQQKEVVSSTFVRTNLTVSTNASTVSFQNPATIHGRVVLGNGTALSNRAVEIRLGERNEIVRTDGEGRFSFEYRPVRVSQDVEAIEVAYLPIDTSVYLGSNTSIDVNVTQVTAALTVSTNVTSVQFGNAVNVSGRALVNGTPVPDARVRVTLGGNTLGTVVTGPDGTYRLTTTPPESVPTGEATVQSVIVPSDGAVRSDATTTSVRVDSTAVSLSVNATQLTDSRLQLSGELRTVDGRPLGNQTVELRVDGSTIATVDTRRDGTFERTVSISESLTGTVTVHAVYDEPSTNLAQADAKVRVDLDSETNVEELLPVSLELFGGGGMVLFSLLSIIWVVRLGTETTVSEPTPTPPDSPTTVEPEPGSDIVEQASSLLSAGESKAAIQAVYAAVRESISAGDDSTRTHWEFYTAASNRLEPEAVETLEQLTEAYERVVYSADSVETDIAEQLLDESAQLISEQTTEVRNAD